MLPLEVLHTYHHCAEVDNLFLIKLTMNNWKKKISFEALVLHDTQSNQSRLKEKHQRKNPRLWLLFFHACLMTLHHIWQPMSQRKDAAQRPAGFLCGKLLNRCTWAEGWLACPPAGLLPAAAATAPKEQHAWLLEHLFSTTEMQHLTFVWARCKYLLRNSLWERDISHDRATYSRWPTALFASLVTTLSFFFF